MKNKVCVNLSTRFGQRLQNKGHKKVFLRNIKEYRISKFAFS